MLTVDVNVCEIFMYAAVANSERYTKIGISLTIGS